MLAAIHIDLYTFLVIYNEDKEERSGPLGGASAFSIYLLWKPDRSS